MIPSLFKVVLSYTRHLTVEKESGRFAWCLIHVYATEVYLWPLPESTTATLSDAILSSDPVL